MNRDYGSERNFFENRVTRACHRQVNEMIFESLHELSRESKILDVGCGDGFFLFFMREFGFKDARGIDLSFSFIERCQKKGLVVKLADIMEYNPDTKFDLITMIELVEHVKDPGVSLKRVHMLLKEDGKVLITVPIFDSLNSRWDRLRCKTTRLQQCRAIDETHIHAFSRRAIFDIVENAGFSISKQVYCYNPLPYRLRKVLSRKTRDILERISLFNNCGEGLFIVAQKAGI